MNILVTGGMGFIGSNYIDYLLNNFPDFKITNIDALFYGSNINNIKNSQKIKNYKFVHGNITDNELMKKLISKNDIIINFAAESFVDRSISNAKPFLESNINGVFTILEILKTDNKKFIHISTDEVYGSLLNGSADEDFNYNPSSPYSSTKASAELLINSYVKTYGCDCLITRCTNNFGPRQFPEKLIPKVIFLASFNKNIPVYGNGKNLRDWLYVEDHCSAITSVLLNGKSGQSYNISSNNELDNIFVIKKILSLMDKSFDLITFVDDRPGHDLRYAMNSSKIRNELNWQPLTSFDDGIKNTIDWYLSNKTWWDSIENTIHNHSPWKN